MGSGGVGVEIWGEEQAVRRKVRERVGRPSLSN